MRYIHRLSFWATHDQLAELRELGLTLDCGQESYDKTQTNTRFIVSEDHPHWPLIQTRMREWEHPFHQVSTEFTPFEVESARHLQLAAWNNGFPQPQDLHKYTEHTYDLAHWCSKCSDGKVQNAPFRIKGEPKWNRRGIMTLIWVFEEHFVPPAIWETVFKPFGITCRPVANSKGVELQTVVQLVVSEEVDIVTEGLTPIPCTGCGRDKYHWVTRGMFPQLVHEPAAAMAKSRQLFGDGWGVHAVIISQELARAMKAHNIRGAEFTPVDAPLPALVA